MCWEIRKCCVSFLRMQVIRDGEKSPDIVAMVVQPSGYHLCGWLEDECMLVKNINIDGYYWAVHLHTPSKV